MRFRLKVAYHGGAFHGWQIQSPGIRTVEGELTKAVEEITGAPTKVWGASRTDAGVHARGQVAAFDYDGPHPAESFFKGLNHLTHPGTRLERRLPLLDVDVQERVTLCHVQHRLV